MNSNSPAEDRDSAKKKPPPLRERLRIEQEARATAEATAVRMRLLADTDRILLSSLDTEVTLKELATLLVPTLADYCVFRLVDEGEWGRIALAHPVAAGTDFAEQLQQRFPIYRDAVGGVHRVLQSGEPLHYETIDDSAIELAGEDREYLQVLRELGITSAILAPLIARGRLRGSLGLFMADSEHRFNLTDLALLKDLATRIALALDNSCLYREVERELMERRRAEAALRESEARFRLMADMAPVLIWMSNLDGLAHFFNKPWLEFTGRSSEEESGEGWLAGVHPEDTEVYQASYLAAFERREPFALEYRLRRHDGEYRWILDHGVPRFDANGEFAGYIGSCIDITPQIEQRRILTENARVLEELTAELEQSVEELELRREEAEAARAAADEANRAKSKFLAVMSHELRTPLNAILGYSDLLEAEVAGRINDGQRQQIQRIQQSALHLLELINRLLSFSRIEADREEVTLERVDLAGLARDAAALIEPQAAEQGLELRVVVPDDVVLADTDPGKVRQMLLNLLSNAVKFTEEGEVEFMMTVRDEEVLFVVRDTGSGIPKEDHQRIFEAFAQADQTRTRRRGGTGLGLSVSRELARLLGGDIEVESAPGVGSTFTIRLPMAFLLRR